MKRTLLLSLSLGAFFFSNAQNQESVMQKLEAKKNKNFVLFDKYAKTLQSQQNQLSEKGNSNASNLEDLRNSAYTFFQGRPFFIKESDIEQNSNANVNVLQDGLIINGLTKAFNGQNIKVSVFDGGRVFANHTDFNNVAGRITNKEKSTAKISAHSTAVTGIMGGKGYILTATAQDGTKIPGNTKGVMNLATFDSYNYNTTTLNGETKAKTLMEKIAASQANLSNHSYGYNMGWDDGGVQGNFTWYGFYDNVSKKSMDLFGYYSDDDESYDMMVYANPSMIIVKAAGNEFGDGPTSGGTGTNYYFDPYNKNAKTAFTATDILPDINCIKGYDCISEGSLAKNIIVVGATDKILSNNATYSKASDVVHSDYSSAGPRDDGGIKPDIAGVGTMVFAASSAENTTGSSTWTVGSGTSFASPLVTGVIGLWTEINQTLFNNQLLNASTAKTLLIHSANEAGPIGPDPLFGWGFADAKKGADILVGKSNSTLIFTEETLANQVKNTKEVTASGTEPLKVTISWIDPAYNVTDDSWEDAYNNRTSRLINDLDLRIIDITTGTVYYPWKLDANSPLTPATKGDNTVDNVEQVIIDSPTASGKYRVEISNKNTLVDSNGSPTSQKYSIIVTGLDPSTLATTEVSAANSIRLYPSIATDVVNLDIPVKATNVSIYDMSGKLVKTVKATTKTTIDVNGLQKGVYLINIDTEKGKVTKKFIKQ